MPPPSVPIQRKPLLSSLMEVTIFALNEFSLSLSGVNRWNPPVAGSNRLSPAPCKPTQIDLSRSIKIVQALLFPRLLGFEGSCEKCFQLCFSGLNTEIPSAHVPI